MGRSKWAVIKVSGHIDQATDELTQALAKEWHPRQNLLIDLSAVTSMDSPRWLFAWVSQVTEAGRKVRLVVSEGGPVERLLSIVAVKNAFTIYRSLDQALARVTPWRFLRFWVIRAIPRPNRAPSGEQQLTLLLTIQGPTGRPTGSTGPEQKHLGARLS